MTANICSCRTYVPMIACLSVPAFDLRVALRPRRDLMGKPAALAPLPDGPGLIGPCTAAAQDRGIRSGMTLGEALATCPDLSLVQPDPAATAEAWEKLLRRLESAGLAVEPLEPGYVLFETSGIEPLAGGLRAALERALVAAGREWQPHIGVAARRFAAIAAAGAAAPGRALVVDDDETPLFLEPLPLDLLPLSVERRNELSALGIRRLGELATLPRPSVADRLGSGGEQAWVLARAEDRVRVAPRRQPADIAEAVEFPEAVANTLSLEHTLVGLLDSLLARPERSSRPLRKLVLTARLVGGGSWRRVVALREPTADVSRLRTILTPRLTELPAPALERMSRPP